jgi:hypothetical protein
MSKTQTFKTPKGTELPMLDLRGKPYLQVAHRLVWFREEHPDWFIKTELVEHDAQHSIFRASILKEDNLHAVATATGHETKLDFPDFIEKAETKAVGRALAMCGYGTQFAPELDEGERLADAPVAPAKPATPYPLRPRSKAGRLVQQAAKETAQATADQVKKVADLAASRLGADLKEPADILAKINAEMSTDFKSSKDLTAHEAQRIIEHLESKPKVMEPERDT